jgi:hypothetical protein
MDTERLTNEQRNFQEAMKVLLDLYYLVKEIDNKVSVPEDSNIPLTPENRQLIKINTDSFFIKPVIILMAKLFHKTIPYFSPCRFFSNPPFFHYRMASEFICFESSIVKSHPFKDFIVIFDSLPSILKKPKISNPFEITKVTREYYAHKKSKILVPNSLFEKIVKRPNGQKYSGRYKEVDRQDRYDQDYPWVYDSAPEMNELRSTSVNSDFLWMNYDDTRGNTSKLTYIKKDVDCRIMPIIPGRLISDYNSESILKDLNIPPPYYELFQVSCKPVYPLGRYFPHGVTVSSPGYLKEKTEFIDVIKYILVKYVSLFGSFNRIKVCKNCGKLFLEKKYGYGIFCNVRCRVNYHIEAEPKNIFRCRARQNRWAGRILLTPYTVLKEECEKCENLPIAEKEPKGGKCIQILHKNANALETKKKE